MKINLNSLGTRLILVLLCLALLPGVATSWIAHDLMFDNLKSDRITDVGLVARARHEQLVGLLNRQNNRAKAFLLNLTRQCVTESLDKNCANRLLQSDFAAENALGMSLYNSAGLLLSLGGAPGKSAAIPFQAGQLAGFSGTGTDLNRSYFISASDALSGYRLVVTYSSSILESIFTPIPGELGVSGETFLADGAGYFVTRHKYPSSQGHSHPISATPMQTCLSGQSHEVLDKDYRDADIIHGFHFIPEFGSACIMAHITQEEAFAPLKVLERRLQVVLLLFALLLTVGAIYLAKRIVRPLRELGQVARSIAAGNYQEKADETGSGELAELGKSFNAMTRQLRSSQQLLEDIVEHIPVMVFLKRASDLRIELFNRAGQQLTGYSSAQLLGTNNYDLWPKEQGDFFTAADRKVLASSEVTEIPEEPITRANGEIRYLQTWKVALRDEDGEPAHLLGISIDITERKQLEDKLREGEERLRFALESAELGAWDLNLITDTSVRTLRHDQLYGYRELQPSWGVAIALKHILPQDSELVVDAITSAMQNGQLSVEFRVRWPDDRVHWIAAYGKVKYDEAGTPVRMSGVVADISERKQQQQEILTLNIELESRVLERTAALNDTTTRIQTILGTVGDGIITINQHGIIETLNSAAERLFGYTAAEVVGQSVNMLMPEPHRSLHDGYIARYLATGEKRIIGRELEAGGLRRDGSTFPLEITVSEMLLGGERYFTGILRDISARKQAELQGAKSIRELAAFKSALDEHAIVATTDVRGTITYVNDKFCAISKYAREELIGQNHRIINSGFHPLDFFRALWRTISSGHVWKGEIQNRAKDGSYYWVDTTIVPFLDEHGKPVQYIAIRADITERKQAQQNLLIAKEQAELANAAKDSFLATMSHEIRTPLTGMLGMVEVLSLTKLDQEQGETLHAVWDSSRSLLRIVNDILDWSKIEEGKLALSPQVTSIPQLLQEVVNTYSRVASAKSLILSQSADSRLGAAHIVDALRLSQVLNNFVSNALKFTVRGEIELRAELLESLESGERIRFSVKDTGIGISPAVQQHLFQRYRQESADTARMYGGTGLGLAICRRLADLMDGEIELVSAPGEGSTFSITMNLPVSGASVIPVTASFSGVEQKKVQPLLDGGDETPLILAVDDHPINRDLLARQIRLLGLRAETAENGEVALALWRQGHFALVITDCHMPEMDGYAFTRALRKIETEEGLPRMPVIAWTANALAEEEALCHEAGMDELLVKPADMAQLKKMLAKWLSLDEAEISPAAMPISMGAPIDFAELGKMVLGSADQLRVLSKFQLHLRADYGKLLQVLAGGDRVNVERTAHRMKGSCRMVGAAAMASACAVIEQAARSGNMASAQDAMAAMELVFTRLDNYLTQLQDTQGDEQ